MVEGDGGISCLTGVDGRLVTGEDVREGERAEVVPCCFSFIVTSDDGCKSDVAVLVVDGSGAFLDTAVCDGAFVAFDLALIVVALVIVDLLDLAGRAFKFASSLLLSSDSHLDFLMLVDMILNVVGYKLGKKKKKKKKRYSERKQSLSIYQRKFYCRGFNFVHTREPALSSNLVPILHCNRYVLGEPHPVGDV
jgi:hypothetical protein